MTQFEIKQVTGEALKETYLPLTSYAFRSSPPLNIDERYEDDGIFFSTSNILVGYEDGEGVSCAIGIPMTQNVRGQVLPMVGIAGVVSHPSARRKGYVRQVMHAQLHQAHENGQAISMLYPFRESFYHRMDYRSFPQIRRYEFSPSSLLILQDAGTVEMMTLKDGIDTAISYLTERQSAVHGLGLFTPEALQTWLGKRDVWIAFAYNPQGKLVGMMTYKINHFGGTMTVDLWFTSNARGTMLLLNWIARHKDQATLIDIKVPATERPETWSPDMDIKAQDDIWITPVARIINLEALAGITVGEGDITIEVTDKICEWNAGTYRLSSDYGALVIEKTDASADLELGIGDLTALFYGTHDPDLLLWQQQNDIKNYDETVRRLRGLFPMATPYLFAQF